MGDKTSGGSEGQVLRGERRQHALARHTHSWTRQGECGHYCDSEAV